MQPRQALNQIVGEYPNKTRWVHTAGDAPDHSCYYDEETGQWICDATETSEDEPEEEGPSPYPEDEEPEPPSPPKPEPPNPADQMLDLAIMAITQAVVSKLTSRPASPIALPPEMPVEAYQYQLGRRQPLMPSQPYQTQPLTGLMAPSPRTVALANEVVNRVDALKKEAFRRNDETLKRQVAALDQKASEARSIVEQAKLATPLQAPARQPMVLSEYVEQPLQQNQTLRNALDPTWGQPNRPRIQEDKAWVERNLSYAAKPKTYADQLATYTTWRTRENQRTAQRVELELMQAQRELAEAQIQTVREQQRQVSQPFADKPWYRKVRQQQVLTDVELKQLFHDFEVAEYAANGHEKARIEQSQTSVLRQLAWNMSQGPNSVKHPEGYVMIGDQAYGTKEAYEKALQSLTYFRKHEKHLPPLPYPISPNLKRTAYPDVTYKIDAILSDIEKEVKKVAHSRMASYPWFKANFANNKKWDLQVNHGLPGQVIKSRTPLVTQDQYAIFRGDVVNSGYLSNFAFGYATAAAGFSKTEAILDAQGAAVFGGQDGDNPKDLEAIEDGWKSYWAEHLKQ